MRRQVGAQLTGRDNGATRPRGDVVGVYGAVSPVARLWIAVDRRTAGRTVMIPDPGGIGSSVAR